MYGWIQLPILLAARQEPELEQKQVSEGGSSGKSKSGEGFIKLLLLHSTPTSNAFLLLQTFIRLEKLCRLRVPKSGLKKWIVEPTVRDPICLEPKVIPWALNSILGPLRSSPRLRAFFGGFMEAKLMVTSIDGQSASGRKNGAVLEKKIKTYKEFHIQNLKKKLWKLFSFIRKREDLSVTQNEGLVVPNESDMSQYISKPAERLRYIARFKLVTRVRPFLAGVERLRQCHCAGSRRGDKFQFYGFLVP